MPYIGKSPTAVPLSASDLDDDIISLAKLASGTDGNLITYDASGNPVAVATGDDGQVLTSAGAGNPCLFEAAAAGGKIGQVVQAFLPTTVSIAVLNTWTDIAGLSKAITPSATDSKILISAVTYGGMTGSGSCMTFRLLRTSTVIGVATGGGGTQPHGYGSHQHRAGRAQYCDNIQFIDEPATTSATTYKLQWNIEYSGSTTNYLNRTGDDNNSPGYDGRTCSSITLWEILA